MTCFDLRLRLNVAIRMNCNLPYLVVQYSTIPREANSFRFTIYTYSCSGGLTVGMNESGMCVVHDPTSVQACTSNTSTRYSVNNSA